ncbi:MAG TPA: serine hydrolase domain-containing protein [Candidatus Edwardsbacteria bacterium]|nr:serine hydrolase domain-containing protein [Candidatus Edwardsbacteria bacterium]
MQRTEIFRIGLLLGLLLAIRAQAVGAPPRIDEYRTWVRQFMEAQKVPGAAVALVGRNGILWSEGFGQRSRRDHRPVDSATLFSIQSVSKTITATAVLLAAQDGLVDLDAPITRYLPDFTVNSAFERQPERKITLRLLLGHAAGLTHEPAVGNNFDCPFPSYQAHDQSIRDTWLKSPVGSRYSYSNCGFDLAAQALEKASGMPFAQYVRTRLFAPLGMASSTLDPAAAMRNKDRAEGSMFGLDRLPFAMPFPGAGSAYVSAGDLARFVRFHLDMGAVDGRQVLKQKYLIDMYRPFITPDYALGVAIAGSRGRFALNHNGGGFGWGATVTWLPQYGIGCLILTNAQYAPGLYELGQRILDDCVATGFAQQDTLFRFDPVSSFAARAPRTEDVPKQCPGDSIFKPSWKRYAGTYRLAFGPGYEFTWYARIARWLGYRVQKVRVTAQGDGLFMTYDNGSTSEAPQRLTEYLPGLFFAPDGEALDFRGDFPAYRNIKLEK